jgi:alkyl sulfatase BDS1-like metallo-beta-lactamase superfamily hydrolase
VKDSVLSSEICQLTGGIDKILRRAHDLTDKGDLNLAVQLVEYALKADPTRRDSHEAAVKIYSLKEETEPSTMAKGIYRGAKNDSERFLKGQVKSTL